MCFKNFLLNTTKQLAPTVFPWLTIVALALGSTGCSLQMGDSNLQPEVLKAKGGLSCVNSLGDVVHSYLKGQMSTDKVHQTFACLNSTIAQFESLTRGEGLSGYSVDEIKNFWLRHFSKTGRLEDQFIDDIFRLKSLFIGGTDQYITRDEWNHFVGWMKTFEHEALRLNRYIDIYSLQASEASPTRWSSAQSELRRVAVRLGQFLKNSPRSYNIIQHSVVQPASYRRALFNLFTYQEWRQYAGFIKQTLVGPPYDYVHPAQWPSLISALVDWYILYLKYNYTLERPLLQGKGFKALQSLTEQLSRQVRQILLAQNNATTHQSAHKTRPQRENTQRGLYLPYDHIFTLARALTHFNLMPYNLRVSTIESVLPFLLENTFKTQDDPYYAKGLSLKQFEQIEKEWSLWLKTQSQLHKVFQSKKQIYNSNSFKNSDFLGLKVLIDNLRPHFRPRDERIYFTFDNEMPGSGTVYSLEDLSRKNIFRALIRLLMRAMSSQTQKSPELRSLSANEMDRFYFSVRPLGVDLQFMSPNSCTAGVRTFLEANIFTFVGDGVHVDPKGRMSYPSSQMSFSEGVEWLTFVYSGMKMSQPFYDTALKRCSLTNLEVHNGLNRKGVARTCFFHILHQHLIDYLDNLPYMQEYLVQIKNDRAQYTQLLKNLELASYSDSTRWITRGEINHIMTILQYVEATFLQFDINKNFRLDNDELWRAYDKFKGYIQYEGSKHFSHIARATRHAADEILEPDKKSIAGHPGIEELNLISQPQTHKFDVSNLWAAIKRALNNRAKWVLKWMASDFDDVWARALFIFFVQQHRMPDGFSEFVGLYYDQLKYRVQKSLKISPKIPELSATRADFIHFMAQMKQQSGPEGSNCD